jgi:hypothetical protein
MKTEKEYPFPLPIGENKDEFLDAIRDVAKAVSKNKGKIKDYYEDELAEGGEAGVIVVEEEA